MTRPIRVLLVDDHFLVRQGLRKYLSHHLDIELVGEATDGEEAVKLTDLLKPDVVVMDIHMPRMNGIEATKRIRGAHAAPVVIGLSINTCTQVVEGMREAGADAFLSKEDGTQHLYSVIKQLVELRFPLHSHAPI
mgnify:CR=1 FL=1